MKILVLGYSGVGKSAAAELLAKILCSSYANTSDAIVDGYAEANNFDRAYVLENKCSLREELFKFGRAKQAVDPLWPQSQQLQDHDILTGLRNPNEIEAARSNNLYDLIIWIDRPGYERGSTDKLSPSDADIIVINNGSIDALKLKLQELISQFL